MATRVLTPGELNRALLARQLLLERRPLPLAGAVEKLAGLQAQWAPAPYVGLWTRVAGFRRETLERALLSRRIVRAVLMRGTIHLVTLADYGIFGAAVGFVIAELCEWARWLPRRALSISAQDPGPEDADESATESPTP